MELNPNQPQSQTKVPPPPTPEVSVRTMQSDIKSITQGEVSPTPEIIAPKQNFSIKEPSFMPESANQMMSEETSAPHASHKGLWILITLIVVIALGAVGYFVIYPMLSTPTVTPITETPVVVAEPEPVAVAPHVSAFSGAVNPVTQFTVPLDTVSHETIAQGLVDQAAFIPEGVTEIVLQDATGGQLPFPTLLTALLPEFLDGQSANLYVENDFTLYLYKDKNGIWPGYIATLKPEGITTLSQWLMNFEKTNLSAFFLSDAGVLSPFKSGTVKGIADRFATGKTAGASLSYATTDTNLFIATSFEGLKASLETLGY